MAINRYNTSARPGEAVAEVINGNGFTLIVRDVNDINEGGGFELGFETMADADAVKTTAKTLASHLAAEIDAAFA